MNRQLFLTTVITLLAGAFLTGCSLLKVSVSTGDPLPKSDVEMRMLTRGFYYDMASEISRTADSIAALAPELRMRVGAVRWKIRATRAGVSAAMQGIPEVALADMWILCRRMNEAFAATPDSLLFGQQSDLARGVMGRLDGRAERLAQQLLSSSRYELMARFVTRHVRENPVTNQGDEPTNTSFAWVEYLRANGIDHAYTTGSIAEVLADVNDRISGQTQQLANSVGWSKDILEMQFMQDSLRTRLGAQLDSLDNQFGRLVVVAENLPGISDKVLSEVNAQASQLIYTINASIAQAFDSFDHQRGELQGFVSQERAELVVQLRDAAGQVVEQALDAVPAVIGKVLFYLVLALVVLIGGPFALGFWLGGVRQRARNKKEISEK